MKVKNVRLLERPSVRLTASDSDEESLKRLPTFSKGFGRHLLRMGLSRASAQAIAFFSLPILSRLYSPDDFGVLAIIQSTSLLFGSVATLRYDLAIVLPEGHNEAYNLLRIGLGVAFVLSIMCKAIMPWTMPYFMVNQEIADIQLANWAIPVLVFLTAANQLGLGWCTRTSAFGLYGGSQLMLAIATAAIPLALFIHPVGFNGLVLGVILALFIVQGILWIYLIVDFKRRELAGTFSWPTWKKLLLKYHSYPLYMTPYTMIGAIRDRVIYFFIGHYGSAEAVGLYSMAQRLTNVPNSLVASTIRPIFFEFAFKQEKDKVCAMVHTIMTKLVVLVVPLITVYLFYPDLFLEIFLGEKWSRAAPYTTILLVPMFPLLLGNWMDRYLDVLGRQRLAFFLETVFSLAAVAAITFSFLMGASVRIAVYVQAIVMAIYFTLWLVLVFRAAGMPRSQLFYVLIVTICVSVVSALVVYLGDLLGGMLLATIFLGIAWSGVTFILVCRKGLLFSVGH